MKTIPRDDMLAKVADRTAQEGYEKFKHDTRELAREQWERWKAKERRDVKTSTAEKPLQAAEAPT